MSNISRMHSIAQVAELLRAAGVHVSPGLIRLEVARGRLGITRVGKRKVYVSESEISRYLRENTTTEGSAATAVAR